MTELNPAGAGKRPTVQSATAEQGMINQAVPGQDWPSGLSDPTGTLRNDERGYGPVLNADGSTGGDPNAPPIPSPNSDVSGLFVRLSDLQTAIIAQIDESDPNAFQLKKNIAGIIAGLCEMLASFHTQNETAAWARVQSLDRSIAAINGNPYPNAYPNANANPNPYANLNPNLNVNPNPTQNVSPFVDAAGNPVDPARAQDLQNKLADAKAVYAQAELNATTARDAHAKHLGSAQDAAKAAGKGDTQALPQPRELSHE